MRFTWSAAKGLPWVLLIALYCASQPVAGDNDYLRYQTTSSTAGSNLDGTNQVPGGGGSWNGQGFPASLSQAVSGPGSYKAGASQPSSSPPSSNDNQGDCGILLDFSGGISNWNDFAAGNNVVGWKASATQPGFLGCCSWSFVSCNAAGNVVALIIDGRALVPWPEGNIIPGLADLTQLNNLTIIHTNISGGLPTCKAGSFASMVQLVLVHNSLSGVVPAAWASCFDKLQILDLSRNSLSGTLPEAWGNANAFGQLEVLALSDNPNITGFLPDLWGTGYGFQSLQGLFLSNNSLIGTLPASWSLSAGWRKLQQLDFSQNSLTGPLPPSWGNHTAFPRLWQLHLSQNSISGPLPDIAWGQPAAWPNLAQLDLSQNNISGSLPSSWTSAGTMPLWSLNLANNSITGLLPGSWSNPKMWSTLQKLDISGNSLSGTLPANWTTNFQQLSLLDLSRNKLGGPLPDEWRTSDDALPQLTTLVLANNSLSGSLPAAWANQTGIRQLTALALSFNSFTGSLPDAWGGINSFDYLRQLFLESCQLQGTLPVSWGTRGAFPLLRTLQVANNSFSGPVPGTWSGFLASVWLKPGNPNICGPYPPQMDVCEVGTGGCAPSSDLICNCTAPFQANQPCNGSYAPSILSPSAAAPFSNQLPSNLAFTLRLTPMTVGNFSDQLQQNLVGALQQVLPSGTSILITSSEDLVTVGFSRRRRLLTTHAARSLLQAQSPSVSTVTSVDGRDANQTFNSVNVTLAISAQSSDSAMQVARDMLNVTETGQLLRSLRSLGFQDLMSVLLVTTAALASPPSSNDAAVTKPHYAMPPAPPVQITSGSSKLGAGGITALVVVPMVAAICLTAGACLLWQRRKRRAPRQLTSASSKADKLDSDSEPRSSGGGLAESTSPLQQSWQALHSHNPLLSFTSFGLVTRGSAGELELPWSDWEARPEEYDIVKRADGSPWELGRGNFGIVFKGMRNRVTPVAIKVMSNGPMSTLSALSLDKKARYLEEFQREILILKSCRDQNIVQFIGASLAEGRTMLVTEFMELGDLYRALQADDKPGDRRFSWYRTSPAGERTVNGLSKRIALDIVRGLAFLHSRSIVHFDLKSANILLARDFTAKLTDVGLAKILSKEYISTLSGCVGTFAWAAPEILLGRECSEKVDIFSFGTVLWELSTCEAPQGRRLRPVEVPREAPQAVVDIMFCCLSENPAERPSAVELVQLIGSLK